MFDTRELKDYAKNQHAEIPEKAAAAEMSVTGYLESEYDPNKDGESRDSEPLSAMDVVLDEFDMTTIADPSAGIYPTRCEDIYEDPAKMLILKELCLNTYRSIAYWPQITSSMRKTARNERFERASTFNAISDTAPGSTLTPFYDAMAHWDQDVEIDIALEELTTRFAETNKKDYRATILEYDENTFTEERIAPGSDVLMAKFETSERPVQTKRRGMAIPFTYDHLADVEFIDKAMEHVAEIAVQREMVKVDEGLECFLTGKGGEDLGGTIIRLQDLDEAATTTFTPKAWLALQKRFKRSYMLSSCIAPDENITDLQLAKVGDTNVMLTSLVERQNAVMSGFGGAYSVMNQLSQGIRIGWHEGLKGRIVEKRTGQTDVKHNAFIAYDKRKGAEYISKMASDIMETTRDMLKLTEYIVCSESWEWISYQPKVAIYIICMSNPHADATLSIADAA